MEEGPSSSSGFSTRATAALQEPPVNLVHSMMPVHEEKTSNRGLTGRIKFDRSNNMVQDHKDHINTVLYAKTKITLIPNYHRFAQTDFFSFIFPTIVDKTIDKTIVKTKKGK